MSGFQDQISTLFAQKIEAPPLEATTSLPLVAEAGNFADGGVTSSLTEFIRSINIDPELAECLTAENVRDLMEAMRQGQMIYVFLAHLESDETLAAGFLAWVAHQGRVITNRTVFIEGKTWYEMLFLSGTARASIIGELGKLDAGRGYLRLREAD